MTSNWAAALILALPKSPEEGGGGLPSLSFSFGQSGSNE
jgi:hypothetical protein